MALPSGIGPGGRSGGGVVTFALLARRFPVNQGCYEDSREGNAEHSTRLQAIADLQPRESIALVIKARAFTPYTAKSLSRSNART